MAFTHNRCRRSPGALARRLEKEQKRLEENRGKKGDQKGGGKGDKKGRQKGGQKEPESRGMAPKGSAVARKGAAPKHEVGGLATHAGAAARPNAAVADGPWPASGSRDAAPWAPQDEAPGFRGWLWRAGRELAVA